MTDAEIIDCTTCKYGYKDEQLGIPLCHHPKRFSEDCVNFNMYEEKEIETEQSGGSEKSNTPGGLDQAAEEWEDTHPFSGPSTSFIAGAGWQKKQMLKEAVEGTVMDFSSNQPRPQVDVYVDSNKYHTGDKVRVIVIPNTDEK